MTQSVAQRCGKIAWHWNTSTLLGQPGVNQWTTTWEVSITQRQIPSRPGNEWFDMKLSESWLSSYNCTGLFELKAPASHSARWDGHMENVTNQPRGTPPAFALLSVWACCRCRRQGQWVLVVCYLPLSWEICWECTVQVILLSREDPFSNIFPAVLWLRYLWLCLTAACCAYNTIHSFCCPVGWTSHT